MALVKVYMAALAAVLGIGLGILLVVAGLSDSDVPVILIGGVLAVAGVLWGRNSILFAVQGARAVRRRLR